MQNPRFSLVIPAFEEAALITQTLTQVQQYLSATQLLDQTEVVVVVAEGRDNTRGLVEAQANRFPFFQLILPGEKVGKGRDVSAGILAARGEFIVFTDADLATPLRHIQPAFALLESGQADMVVGTRNLWKVHKTLGRRLLSGGANLLVRLALLPGIQDSQCGFKGFTRQAAHQLFSHLTTVGWGFDLELLVLARENRLRLRTLGIPDWADPKLSAGLVGEPAWKAVTATLQELWRIRQQHPLIGRPLVRFSLASLLSGLVFLGLQLTNLTRWSFWHDESFTALLIQYDWGELLKRAAYDVHPPLYYLVLKLWATIFGSSVLALRSFSVLCMLAVFGLSVWLVKRLAGLRAAWWALPFLALAPALVRYGQEARMYGLAAVLGLCATHILLSLLSHQDMRRGARWWALWGAYLISLVALLYTHYFGFLVVLTHWTMFWIHARELRQMIRSTWWWPVTFILLLLAFIPWIPSFQQQLGGTIHNYWIEEVSINSLLSTISTFLIFRPERLSWRLTGWYALLVLVSAALLGYIVNKIIKTTRLSSLSKVVLLGYWSLPMITLFLLSLPPLTPYYYDRYFVTFSPVFYLLLGVGSWLLADDTKKRPLFRWLVPVGLLGLLLYGTWTVQTYGNNFGHAKQDTFSMRELSADIRDLWQPGDVVVCLSREQFFDAHYYLGDLTQVRYFTLRPFDQFGDAGVVFEREDILLNDLSDLFLPSGRVWIISDKDEALPVSIPSNWEAAFEPLDAGYAKASLYLLK
ncbi:MAG: glycosyltransferase [Patescibacteria group bacterium]